MRIVEQASRFLIATWLAVPLRSFGYPLAGSASCQMNPMHSFIQKDALSAPLAAIPNALATRSDDVLEEAAHLYTRRAGESVRFTDDRTTNLNAVGGRFGLRDSFKMYLKYMWSQLLIRKEGIDSGAKEPLVIGKNFIPAAQLDPETRANQLGSIPYADIRNGFSGMLAKRAVVTVCSLDGGLGENLKRMEWLRRTLWTALQNTGFITPKESVQPRLGAKGTDLNFSFRATDGREINVTVAEASLAQLILQARARTFAMLHFQPLVNKDSLNSYNSLLDMVNIWDRAQGKSGPTYRELLEGKEPRLSFHPGHPHERMLLQQDIPAIHRETGELSDRSDIAQPGGHGQWGLHFLWTMYKVAPPVDGNDHFIYFKNGDNVNGAPDAAIVEWMMRHHIAIAKLTTAATPMDKKGGKDGLRVLHLNGREVLVPEQMEKADAEAAGQLDLFYQAGQEGEEKGKQPFNTNLIYFNYTLLHNFLVDISRVIGEDRLGQAIAPTLIPNKTSKKDKAFDVVDGAIGSSIHNLNRFLLLAESGNRWEDERIRKIMAKHNIKRLLDFPDVPRDRFFAPLKNAFDFWFRRYSDSFRFDDATFSLVQTKPGFEEPEVELVGPYWEDLQNLLDSLGNASTVNLRKLVLKGKVVMRNARLIGAVEIDNRIDELVDLSEPRYGLTARRDQLELANVTVSIDRNEDGQLVIHVDRNGRPGSVQAVAPSNGPVATKQAA